VRKIKITAHSEKEYIFSGEETLSYGLKGKYITHGYSVIPSPGVKIFFIHRHTFQPSQPRTGQQVAAISHCFFSLSRPGLYTQLTPATAFRVENTTYRTETLSGSPPSWN
jgi:hypothetical protein